VLALWVEKTAAQMLNGKKGCASRRASQMDSFGEAARTEGPKIWKIWKIYEIYEIYKS